MHDYGVYSNVVDLAFVVEELEDSNADKDEHANENNTHHHRNLMDLER
jgi:hypothetical protein